MKVPIGYYNENGVYIEELIDVIEPTNEELIAQKEIQLLAVYAEIEALKLKTTI
jgi:hypothetical protein